MNKLRKNTFVTVKEGVTDDYPFYDDFPLIYIGEIASMPEHGIFVGRSGKCYSGYHIWNFHELGEEEIQHFV